MAAVRKAHCPLRLNLPTQLTIIYVSCSLYLADMVMVFFDRKRRRGRVREGRGVSIWHHVLWPMHRGRFGEGAGIKVGGGRGVTVGRWGRIIELRKEERNRSENWDSTKEGGKLREKNIFIHTYTLCIICVSAINNTRKPFAPLHTPRPLVV